MDTRLAIIAIIIEASDSVEKVNTILHNFVTYIIVRMDISLPKKNILIITIVIDAPQDVISSLSGKLGQIPSVSIKTTYSKV